MKLISVLAASIAALVAMAPAQAAVTFKLSGVTFTDGTSVSGSFTTNDAFTSVTDFSIVTRDGTFDTFLGPLLADGFTFAPTNASASIGSTNVSFTEVNAFLFPRRLSLDFDLLAEGSVALEGGAESVFFLSRDIASGELVGEAVSGGPGSGGPTPGAVPEPASWAMLIGGFGAVGGTLRRRRQKVRTAVSFA